MIFGYGYATDQEQPLRDAGAEMVFTEDCVTAPWFVRPRARQLLHFLRPGDTILFFNLTAFMDRKGTVIKQRGRMYHALQRLKTARCGVRFLHREYLHLKIERPDTGKQGRWEGLPGGPRGKWVVWFTDRQGQKQVIAEFPPSKEGMAAAKECRKQNAPWAKIRRCGNVKPA